MKLKFLKKGKKTFVYNQLISSRIKKVRSKNI